MQYTGRAAAGLATLVPFARTVIGRRARGNDSARYCYCVWLRHLCTAARRGRRGVVPRVVGELGPGDSVGTGAAALLSGAERYYAFDVVAHADALHSERILDELVDLYKRREQIPDEDEFPHIHPRLSSYDFPADILCPDVMRETLAPPRVEAIRADIHRLRDEPNDVLNGRYLHYDPSWLARTERELPERVEFMFSQAVMEHVDDVERVYRAVYRWLQPGGLASHDIDLTSHGFARGWSGHWTYGPRAWRLIRGRRQYAINRMPASEHRRLVAAAGFEFVVVEPSVTEEVPVSAADTARDLVCQPTLEDLRTPSVYFLVRRPRKRSTQRTGHASLWMRDRASVASG